MKHRIARGLTGLFFIATFIPVTAYADDVQDSIQEALESYNSGDYQEAVESLSYATQLIQQKKGEQIAAVLPEPLQGWQAKQIRTQTAGAAMMGGGLSVKREYVKDTAMVKIAIVSDSPIIQGMLSMFTNPMFAGADGGKLERIGRQKAVIKYDTDNHRGEITMVVNKRFLITLKGTQTSLKALKAYAKAIDYHTLKKL